MIATPMFSRGLLACALLLPVGAALAANPELGRQKAEQVCASCHGKDGNTPIDPSYPKLAGQHKDFLERALLDYRSEARKNAIMVGQAKQLSREDVRNLAAYYSSLPGGLSVGR